METGNGNCKIFTLAEGLKIEFFGINYQVEGAFFFSNLVYILTLPI